MTIDTETRDAAPVMTTAQPTINEPPRRPLSLGSRLAFALAKRIHIGSFDVTTPEGARRRYTGPVPGPVGKITINHPRMARRMVLGGNIGLGEAYMDGDYDSDDLASFLTVGALNSDALDEVLRGKALYRVLNRAVHSFNQNSKRGSKRNIAYHYDLGNAFYREWLDPSMTYSAAAFHDGAATLEEAQSRKYELLLDRLAAKPEDHVLEIGCGWGGFAEHAAKTRGCKVTGITISQAQHDFARERIQREGLNEKVEIRLQDYRDTGGEFDGVASIEMFEAVGEKYWPVFFDNVRERLREGGRAALQVITIADKHFDYYKSRPDFIQRYIFPGGMLPSPSVFRAQSEKAGLSVDRMEGFGFCYAKTLAEWNRRFQEAWGELKPMGYDDRFKRMWEYYLAYCEAGFRAGSIDVQRIQLAKR
ncbi:MAG: cyclopropane-fatty-acyl-phospholipid synthase family protein [Marivibrio sp.]|uniref:cyclopropane-fatty-acyl-phospholipid synthase family protein n=1 Tax=Marivibrio sp. TaxID=2039719 RepID=UPI0032EE145D